MTYQSDPERVRNPTADDMVRQENTVRDAEIERRNNEAVSSFGVVPTILTILVLLGVGYLAYTMLSPRGLPDTPRTTEYSAPRDVTPTPAPPVSAPDTK